MAADVAEQPRPLSVNRPAASREGEATANVDGGSKKATYPWVPMILLMTVTAGQRSLDLARFARSVLYGIFIAL